MSYFKGVTTHATLYPHSQVDLNMFHAVLSTKYYSNLKIFIFLFKII